MSEGLFHNHLVLFVSQCHLYGELSLIQMGYTPRGHYYPKQTVGKHHGNNYWRLITRERGFVIAEPEFTFFRFSRGFWNPG